MWWHLRQVLSQRAHGLAESDRVRVLPSHRSAKAVAFAALVAVLLAGWFVLRDQPHASPIVPEVVRPVPAPSASRASPSEPAPSPSGVATTVSSADVVVHVAGQVARPGIYRLPSGSRVDDAVRAAGGARPGVDLAGLNLAQKVVDGQQIAVGVPGAVNGSGSQPAGGGGGNPAGGSGGPVNLNTATLEQLTALPGIGPVLAQHILDWRAAHGRFESVDQLTSVSGIGTAKFASLRPLVTV